MLVIYFSREFSFYNYYTINIDSSKTSCPDCLDLISTTAQAQINKMIMKITAEIHFQPFIACFSFLILSLMLVAALEERMEISTDVHGWSNLKRLTTSVGINRFAAVCHRQGREIGLYSEMDLDIVYFKFYFYRCIKYNI